MNRIELKAYAKVNLFLDVVSRESNGFHGIESVMQSISLADDISIEAERCDNTEIILSCDSQYAPNGIDNIAYRAASVFLDRANITARININVKKRIPSPAGMGGGSADAAAVLRGLNKLFGSFSIDELETISAEIGSDVPFCIRGGTQLAKGRGEALQPLPSIPDCYFVIGCGEDLLSTPRAYKMLDEKYNDFSSRPRNVDQFIKNLDSVDNMSRALYNIFEDVAKYECPSVVTIKNIIAQSGAIGNLLSGSGPAVFGIFSELSAAGEAANKLSENGFFTFVATKVEQYY